MQPSNLEVSTMHARDDKKLTYGGLLLVVLMVALFALAYWLLTGWPAEAAVVIQNNCWIGDNAGNTIDDGARELNCLVGRDGVDVLYGRAGNDWIRASEGDSLANGGDWMMGGPGSDRFAVGPGNWMRNGAVPDWRGIDHIVDIEAGEVLCSNAVFGTGNWFRSTAGLSGDERWIVARVVGGMMVIARVLNLGNKPITVIPACQK